MILAGMLEVAVGMMDAKRIADSDGSAPIQIPPEMNELLAGTPEEVRHAFCCVSSTPRRLQMRTLCMLRVSTS